MKQLVDKCILLIAASLVCLQFGILCYEPKTQFSFDNPPGFTTKDMYVELPEIERDPVIPESNPVFEELRELNIKIAEMPITITRTRMVLYDAHTVFLTAYCAEECGWNYSTSSGEICHRSSEDNHYEPTTCAIDLRYFRYGTMFYVPSEDRVYIAEDTGPGVQGLWIDTYQDDMSDVYGYNTRYETVYICDFEDYEETMRIPNIREYMKIYMQEYLGFPTNR